MGTRLRDPISWLPLGAAAISRNLDQPFCPPLYSFSTGNWTSTEALPQSLYASSSTLLGKEMVIAGGFANFGRVTDIIRFDRDAGNNGMWMTMDQKLQKARNHAAMVSVSDGAAQCA